jgi:hypothetical protein
VYAGGSAGKGRHVPGNLRLPSAAISDCHHDRLLSTPPRKPLPVQRPQFMKRSYRAAAPA